MKKYLIISTVGDKSLHHEWVKNIPNFDLVLIYYGEKEEIAKEYLKYTSNVYISKGEKFHLIKSFITENLDFVFKYQYIWLPDDDISISTSDINKLFETAEKYQFLICQPAVLGYSSHEITKPINGNLFRYTNFVEIMAPLFEIKTLLQLYTSFNLNNSGWGYEYYWDYLLNHPKDKIAIIDSIIMVHTRPVGDNYSRFLENPWEELIKLLNSYNITKKEITYTEYKNGQNNILHT